MIGSIEIQVGTLLNNRYHLDAILGQGGMGVVYRAHDALLDRDVAVKVLSTTVLSAESRGRLLHEARAAAKLNHPNIVSVHDVIGADQAEDVPFIVMELVEGESLQVRRPQTLDEILSIARQMCAALEHAHAHGIIHRDLKPENVVIATGGVAKLTDFGLARSAASRISTDGRFTGTVFYIPPEQALGQNIDGRADLYALGVMLYELTTGQLPFTSDDPLAVVSQHVHAPVVPPSTHNLAIPPALDALIVQLLSKRPEDRPASPREVKRVLDSLILGASDPATSLSAVKALDDRRDSLAVPLLSTKLYVPPVRSELVPRPRLIRQLNEGLTRKLTLISAPAGFGKTTLVSEWLSGLERAYTWLSLDESDNDLARFLTYVITALQQIDPSTSPGQALGQATRTVLQTSPSPAVEPLITALINEIAALNTTFVLVLDDYHVITLSTIHEAMAFLLDHMPPPPRGIHLVIATREDPPLPTLARLRVQRQMTELRAGDMRFTGEEVDVFLNKAMGLDLTSEDIRALETRTEGWVAGLQLAALSMQGEPAGRIPGFIQAFTGSHRYVVDYLGEEVLKRRPPGTRSFLLQTSILNRLTGPLCDAVTEQEDSQATLERMDEANLFLVPLDNERRWYRYHHLFADLLRNQLGASQPDLVPTLHRRASVWYEGNDLMSEAIAHSLAAEDFERAAELTEQTFNDMMSRGEYFTTMLHRLEALPDEIVRASPHLGILYAWMLSITLQLDAVEPILQEVEVMANGQLPDDLRLQIAHVRAEVTRHRGQLGRAIELSHQILETLPENPSYIDRQTFTGAVFNLAEAYLPKGDVIEARKWASEALTLSQTLGSITLTLTAMMLLAQVQVLQGQLYQALETYRQALQMADEFAQQSGQEVPATANVHLGLADLLREWNRLDEAERHLVQGIELGRQWQIGEALRDGYLFHARLKQAQGDMAGALDAIRQAEGLPQVYQAISGYAGPIGACRARLAMTQAASAGSAIDPRQLEAVRQWIETRGLDTDSLQMPAIRINSLDAETEYLIWARLLIVQNKPDQALQVLAHLLQVAEDGGRAVRVIEILAIQALAQQALGDTKRALLALERSLSLAEPEEYVRLFVDEGTPMMALLEQLTVDRQTPAVADYVRRLFAAFPSVEQKPKPSPQALSPPAPQLLEPLTGRELEVLRLLITDLSGPEIAEELFVSTNTLKTHIKRIYGKLDVHSRYEAVERAKELDLF